MCIRDSLHAAVLGMQLTQCLLHFAVMPGAGGALPATGDAQITYPDIIPESDPEDDDNGLVTQHEQLVSVVDGIMPGRATLAAVVNARVVQRQAQAAAALEGKLRVTWQKKR